MINVETIIKVTDNSGAILVKCIKVLKISKRIGAIPGQIITIVVIKNVFKKHVTKKSKIIHRKSIYKALILQTVKGIKRWGRFFIRFNKNSVTLLNNYNLPFATRIFGIIIREIRASFKYSKILSLSELTI